ncbi:MAG TPA: photosynthetic complex putative assembly protein PuhB [Steroidobacteraceae bacterium]|nr:photosynthetic complex putative assembly protein PuhB [Steroidobacteraceae bacterium]
MTSEHDYEPVRGLPAPLPPGENLLWQGSPRWQTLAVRAFHVRKVAVYFAVLLALRGSRGALDGATLGPEIATTAALGALALLAIGLLMLLAWLSARSTVYTITDRRVVMRFGVALSLTLNVPFKVIESAAVRIRQDGTGDIPLELKQGEKLGYLVNWPHVRPWHFMQPQPMLRALPDVAHAAETLARALAAAAGTSLPAAVEKPRTRTTEAVSEPRATVAA